MCIDAHIEQLLIEWTYKVEPAKEEPAKEGEEAVGQSVVVFLFPLSFQSATFSEFETP